jgi:hypothetical protein
MLYTKLNLPPLELPEVWHTEDIELKSENVDGYISYWLTEEVEQYVRSFLPKNYFNKNIHSWLIAATFRKGTSGFIHKDARHYAINYLITSGGDNVVTEFYDDNDVMIDSYIQQPGEWYFLNTLNKHCVRGITGKRTQVSYSIYEDFTKEQWKFIESIKCDM